MSTNATNRQRLARALAQASGRSYQSCLLTVDAAVAAGAVPAGARPGEAVLAALAAFGVPSGASVGEPRPAAVAAIAASIAHFGIHDSLSFRLTARAAADCGLTKPTTVFHDGLDVMGTLCLRYEIPRAAVPVALVDRFPDGLRVRVIEDDAEADDTARRSGRVWRSAELAVQVAAPGERYRWLEGARPELLLPVYTGQDPAFAERIAAIACALAAFLPALGAFEVGDEVDVNGWEWGDPRNDYE